MNKRNDDKAVALFIIIFAIIILLGTLNG